jgi:recombination protein RecA
MALKLKDGINQVQDSDDLVPELIKQLKKLSNTNMMSDTKVKHWIPTGIKVLDVAISNKKEGGFPSGILVEIFGDQSSGKTLLALLTAKQVLDGGGYVIWCDTEHALSQEENSLTTLFKLDTTKRFLQVEPTCIDEVFMLIESAALTISQKFPEKKLLVVWDSIAATPARAELEGEYSDKMYAPAAREIGQGFRKILQIIGRLNCLFLALNQIRMKIGDQHQPYTTPGGMAASFAASIRIELKKSSLIKAGTEVDADVIGNVIKAKIVKNRYAPPYRKCKFKMFYTKGVDEMESVFDLLLESGFIKGKGWYTFGDSDKKFQKSKALEYLKNDKDINAKAMEAFYDVMILRYDHDDDNYEELEEDAGGNVRDPKTKEILYNSNEREKEVDIADSKKIIVDGDESGLELLNLKKKK